MASAVPLDELTGRPAVQSPGIVGVLLANRKFVIGFGFFVVLLVTCLVGQLLAGPIPLRSGSFPPKLGVGSPGFAFAGTTTLGQSVLAQLFQAIPNSMLVGLVAAIINFLVRAYDVNGRRIDEMPMTQTDVHHAVPVYEEMPGWWEDLSQCRTLDELPPNARAYVTRLEQLCGARISAIGVGPGRDQTITLHAF